jgi:hypothetical protein
MSSRGDRRYIHMPWGSLSGLPAKIGSHDHGV